MFKRLRLRFRDMKTLAKLIPGAEAQAKAMGEEKPGAEHFVLSALKLEDGTALRIFSRLGIDAKTFKQAIRAQYDEALGAIGIPSNAMDIQPEPIESNKILLESQPSGQDLIKSLHALKKEDRQRPLLGAHVLIVAAAIKQGVVPRVFKTLKIDQASLSTVAREELMSA